MQKGIGLLKKGEEKMVCENDLSWVIDRLERGANEGHIEAFQHTSDIRAYRRKVSPIGSTILSWDQNNGEQIFFDSYQFKLFCDDLQLNISYSLLRS